MSIAIESVRATWQTPFSGDMWAEMEEAKTTSSKAGSMDLLLFGPTLPDADEPRVATLAAHVHDSAKGSAEPSHMVHWAMIIRKAPAAEPPQEIREGSDRLGGRSGLMARLERWLAGVPPIASFQTSLKLARGEYQCRLLPREVHRDGFHDAAVSLGVKCHLEQVGYRFENSPYGLDELAIVYGHEGDLFAVTVRSAGALRIGAKTWLPHADEVADIVTRAFFVRGGTAS